MEIYCVKKWLLNKLVLCTHIYICICIYTYIPSEPYKQQKIVTFFMSWCTVINSVKGLMIKLIIDIWLSWWSVTSSPFPSSPSLDDSLDNSSCKKCINSHNDYIYSYTCYCTGNLMYTIYSNTDIHMYIYVLYFVWADQRDKKYFIFHKIARVLCGKITLWR